jgi:hypothetical protein
MTLDAGIHHLGTRPVHIAPPFAIGLLGVVLNIDWLMAFAVGMLLMLLIGNVRCRAPYYRYRVRDPGPREDETRE